MKDDLKLLGKFIFNLDLTESSTKIPFLYHSKILRILNIFSENIYDG